jgi:hypothetical protein
MNLQAGWSDDTAKPANLRRVLTKNIYMTKPVETDSTQIPSLPRHSVCRSHSYELGEVTMRKVFLIGLVLMAFGRSVSAQHLGELSLDYSYMHYVPVDNLSAINMNGGGGAAVLYLAGVFGLKAEVQGYASKNINFSFPPGSVRCPAGCSGTAEANLFNGNVGPTIKIRIKAIQPFVEGLVGGAHTNFYENVHKNCAGCLSASPGDWALNFVIGGGIDVKLGHHWAIRPIEADYILTRFINDFTTGHNNQNNFRYQAGLVFEF